MSPSTHIVPRRTATRGTRFQVRFRWRPSDSTARYFASDVAENLTVEVEDA